MRIILLLLFIILCIVIAAIILYLYKFHLAYEFGSFMSQLEYKLRLKYGDNHYLHFYEEYQSVFGKYEYLYGLGAIFLYFFTAIEIAILILSILLQTCKSCCKICRGVFSLLLLFICIVYRMMLLIDSFRIKNEVNFTDDEIYIFDSSFNNEIKEKLQIMYDRKIYMIIFGFVAIIGEISQFALIIVDLVKFKKNLNVENNNNINEQHVAVFQETERPINLQSNPNVKQGVNQAILYNVNQANSNK